MNRVLCRNDRSLLKRIGNSKVTLQITGCIQLKIFSLFKSAIGSANCRNRMAVRAKRPGLFVQSDFFEGLENRRGRSECSSGRLFAGLQRES